MKKIKLIVLRLILFLCYTFISFFVVGSMFCLLNEFKLISPKVFIYGLLFCSIGIGTVLAIVNYMSNKTDKKTRMKVWFDKQSHNIILMIILFPLCMLSIKSEILWSPQDMHDIISMQWTVVGISATIILVWNILIINPLKKIKPDIPEQFPEYLIASVVDEKINYIQKVNNSYNSIIMFNINLAATILSSMSVYGIIDIPLILVQTIVIMNFYLCTNTISMLFIDITSELKKEKKDILKNISITNEEINKYNAVTKKFNNVDSMIKLLDSTNYIDEDTKKSIIKKMMEDMGFDFEKKEIATISSEGGDQ